MYLSKPNWGKDEDEDGILLMKIATREWPLPEHLGRVLFYLVAVLCITCRANQDACSSDPAVPIQVFVVPLSHYSGTDSNGGVDKNSTSAILDAVAKLMTQSNHSRYRFNWSDLSLLIFSAHPMSPCAGQTLRNFGIGMKMLLLKFDIG